ncbi:uncharacterized protein LOC104266835 [Ciona intestinalis]
MDNSGDRSNYVLMNMEVILDKILSYLPIVYLLPKQRVCKFWSESVQRIQRQRRTSAVVWLNASKTLNDSKTEKENRLDVEYMFMEWRERWVTAPKIIIMTVDSDDQDRVARDLISKSLCKKIPLYCQIYVLNAHFHTDASASEKMLNELLSDKHTHADVVYLLNQSSKQKKEVFQKEFLNFMTSIKDVKCILLFCYQKMLTWVSRALCPIIEEFTKSNSECVVIGGALLSKCINFSAPIKYGDNRSLRSCGFFALGIGNKSAVANSVLIHSDVNTISGLQNRFLDLRNSFPPPLNLPTASSKSLAVFVSCIARKDEHDWYNDLTSHSPCNVERTTLQQTFKNTPLLSLYGYGELGKDSFSNAEAATSSSVFRAHSCSLTCAVIYFGM